MLEEDDLSVDALVRLNAGRKAKDNDDQDKEDDNEEHNDTYTDSTVITTTAGSSTPQQPSSPPARPKRSVVVTFEGMLGPSPPPIIDLAHASKKELIAKVEGLQDKLVQTQIYLKQEKQSRKRKEKNIIKLATELGRKQTETSQQEQDIVKLTTLLQEMATKLDKATQLEDNLRQSVSAYEQKWKKLTAVDTISQQPSPPLSTITRKRNATTTTTSHPPLWWWYRKKMLHACLLIGMLLLFVYLVSLPWVGSLLDIQDSLCAPIRPGNRLYSNQDMTVTAPWWIPVEAWKDGGFQSVCQGRQRIRIKIQSSKGQLQVLYQKNDHHHDNTQWKRLQRIEKFEVVRYLGSSLLVTDKRNSHRRRRIPVPWGALSSSQKAKNKK